VAIRIRAEFAEAQAALGTALCAQGRFDEGISHLQRATTIAPQFSGAQQSLGEAYASQGRMALAVEHYERALELRPDDVMLLNRIGWILATDPSDALRNGRRALTLAERAVQLTGRRDAASLDTLAVAKAELGRTSEAVATGREALAVATQRGERDYVVELGERLKVFEAGHPFRQHPRAP
jgi:tetratricopeptide (TPR) repeat protein